MDKIGKALARLNEKERQQVKTVLAQLVTGEDKGLDIKKLKGREDIFRVRKGDIRIIYRTNGGTIFVLAIERRAEKTYRDL